MSLHTRIERLEERLTPPLTERLWQICVRAGESLEAALARHGITPGPHDRLIIHHYGRCPACAPGTAQARGTDGPPAH
jgi:hypothetical protein